MSKVPQEALEAIREVMGSSEQGSEFMEAAKLRIRDRCREDLWFLCYYILGNKDINNKFHIDLCRAWVQRSSHPYTLWQLARSHLKTTLLTIGDSIREALVDPNVRQIIFTATADLGTAILGEIQEHFEKNELLRWLFPEFIPDELIRKRGRKRGESSGYWKTDRISWPCRTKMTKDPSIMIGTLGSSKTGFHFDIGRYDDVVTRESSLTPESCEATYTWFLNTKQLAHDPATYRRRLVGTPWSYADLQSREIRKELAHRRAEKTYGKKVRNRLLVYRKPVWAKPGVPSWPERFTPETINDIEADLKTQPGVFPCQYLLDPTPPSESFFSEKDIQLIPEAEIPKDVVNFCAVDLAEEKNVARKTDYTVISVCSFDIEGRMYVRDVYRDRLSPLDLIDRLFMMAKKWGVKKVALETVAFQTTILKHYKREAFARGLRINFQPMKRQGTRKHMRIMSLQPMLQCGDFFIQDNCPHLEEIIEEFVTYDSGMFDDILDTLADNLAISTNAPVNEEGDETYGGTMAEIEKYIHGGLDNDEGGEDSLDLLDVSVM
jgi:predicted phage terminase large subunit-like protein